MTPQDCHYLGRGTPPQILSGDPTHNFWIRHRPLPAHIPGYATAKSSACLLIFGTLYDFLLWSYFIGFFTDVVINLHFISAVLRSGLVIVCKTTKTCTIHEKERLKKQIICRHLSRFDIFAWDRVWRSLRHGACTHRTVKPTPIMQFWICILLLTNGRWRLHIKSNILWTFFRNNHNNLMAYNFYVFNQQVFYIFPII